jgi:hypothetical protein
MSDFLKQFFEGLSCGSLAPVFLSKPISDLKFSFLGGSTKYDQLPRLLEESSYSRFQSNP